METVSISVTEAARNFSDCINRTRYSQTTFVLHKNGRAVARIVPEAPKAPKTGRHLAEALAQINLSPMEIAEWRRDVAAARAMLES